MTRKTTLMLACLALTGLGACSQTPRPSGKAAVMVQPVGNAQQISDVVAALESGDVERARKLLKGMAKRDPTDVRVATLRESIEGDPVALLGSKSFAYAVQRGDTLPALAQRFVGDRLKFFLIARYNGLAKGEIASGQTLRIPGIAPPPPEPVVVRPRPEARPHAAMPPKPARPAVAAPKTNPALAAALRGRGLSALNQGRVAEAVGTLRRARFADPANVAVQRDLARAERLLAAVRSRK